MKGQTLAFVHHTAGLTVKHSAYRFASLDRWDRRTPAVVPSGCPCM